jgi:hypothetical protein
MVASRPHTHRSILRAAGHITLTPVNQLLVKGYKIWTLSNTGFASATFRSLAQRAYQPLTGPTRVGLDRVVREVRQHPDDHV